MRCVLLLCFELVLVAGRRVVAPTNGISVIETGIEDAVTNTAPVTVVDSTPTGAPDVKEKKWLMWKVLHAKHLPFHHFLDIWDDVESMVKRDTSKDQDGAVSPVVLVGGLMSSSLYADLDNAKSAHWYCSTKGKHVHLWLAPSQLMPWTINCWYERMTLQWNVTSAEYEDNGVHVDVASYGDIEGYIFDMWDIVYAALQPLGYGKKSIRGTPFDWRFGPREWKAKGFYQQFKDLVEKTYAENNKRKVVPISISQGGLFVRHFLASDTVDAAWKDKFIDRWVSLSGIFEGSPDALSTIIFPGKSETEGISYLPWASAKAFRDMGLSWSSAYSMIPPSTTKLSTPYVITTPTKNYTLAQVAEAMTDAQLPSEAASLFKYSGPQAFADDLLAPPGVDVHCWYGRGLKTIDSLTYGHGLGAPPTGYGYADGDGSVIESSLAACQKWTSRDPAHSVDAVVFPGLAHKDLVIHQSPVSRLVSLLETSNARLDGA